MNSVVSVALRSTCLLILLAAASLLNAGEAPRIAVLRYGEIMRECAPFAAAEKIISSEMASMQATDKQFIDTIKAGENKLRLQEAGSEEYRKIAEQIEQLQLKLKQQRESWNAVIQRRYQVMLRNGSKLISEQLADFARAKGLLYVGKAPEPELPASVPTSQIELRLGTASALYADPSIDITAEFKVFFNERTKNVDIFAMPASATAAASVGAASASAAATRGLP